MPTAEWLSTYTPKIDDLRSALDWAFAPSGDAGVRIALTVAAVPLWFEMSLMEECRACAERALTRMEKSAMNDDRRRMLLSAAIAWSQMYTTVSGRDTGVAWATTGEIAKALGDTDYRLRALWGTWATHLNRGEFGAALSLAKRAAMAERDFLESIRLARSQEAVAWELRSATSLGRLWLEQGRISEAYELISAAYGRFREGYKTDDLRAAKSLLGELSGHR